MNEQSKIIIEEHVLHPQYTLQHTRRTVCAQWRTEKEREILPMHTCRFGISAYETSRQTHFYISVADGCCSFFNIWLFLISKLNLFSVVERGRNNLNWSERWMMKSDNNYRSWKIKLCCARQEEKNVIASLSSISFFDAKPAFAPIFFMVIFKCNYSAANIITRRKKSPRSMAVNVQRQNSYFFFAPFESPLRCQNPFGCSTCMKHKNSSRRKGVIQFANEWKNEKWFERKKWNVMQAKRPPVENRQEKKENAEPIYCYWKLKVSILGDVYPKENERNHR